MLLIALLASLPVQAASKAVDLDGDGSEESTVQLNVLQTWPPKIQNRVISGSSGDQIFNWLSSGPGGFNSKVRAGGEARWTWETAQTVYSFTGTSCRSDMCTRKRDGSFLSGAFSVPGRTVYSGSVTTSTASLTSSLIQSFSPGVTLLQCTDSVGQLANGNFAYTTTCENNTGDTLVLEQLPTPLGCCFEPNQLNCDDTCVDYLTDPDNCGGCGNQCGDSQVCSMGSCQEICDPDLTWCSGTPHDPETAVCLDLLNDPENCGACGAACGSTSICKTGVCEACPRNLKTRCGNECVNLKNNDAHCGACYNNCNIICPSGGNCSNGKSCICNDTTASTVGDELFFLDETTLRQAPRGTRQQQWAPPATFAVSPAGALLTELPSPAPICESQGNTITIPPGGTYTECTANPNLPLEVQGSLKACGGAIPDGSPVCGAVLGTQGIFQQFEPSMVTPGPTFLSVVGVTVDDASNNGLLEPGESACFTVEVANSGTDNLTGLQATLVSPAVDLDCGEIDSLNCAPEGGNPVGVTVTQGQSAYPDLMGVPQTMPANDSCDFPPAATTPGSNLTQFCVQLPSDHPEDLGRPFALQFTGNSSGGAFSQTVPFTVAVSGVCHVGERDFPDGVMGLESPMAELVPVDQEPVFAKNTFNQGNTRPLKLRVTCGGVELGDRDVDFAPEIVRLVGETVGEIDITMVDINDDGGPNPEKPFFRYNKPDGPWIFNMRTVELPVDRYVITIRINDVKDYHTGFELR